MELGDVTRHCNKEPVTINPAEMCQCVDNFGEKDDLGIDKNANVGVWGSLCSRDHRVEEWRPREPKPRVKTALISSWRRADKVSEQSG